jgi:hypothetical protein
MLVTILFFFMSLPPAARPILERLACVCYLGLLLASLTGMWLGTILLNWPAIGGAIAGLLVTRWLHVHGHAHWHFRECLAAVDAVKAGNRSPRVDGEEELSGEVRGLFARMEAEPDVWTRGELRREIAVRLAAQPTLREEFAENLARHPEI